MSLRSILVLAGAVFAIATFSGPIASVVAASYSCSGQITKLFDNRNGAVVSNGAVPPSFNTGGKAYCLTSITTYHWNGGRGDAPGTIGLTGSSVVAPAQAAGAEGQGGAPNVNWTVTYSTNVNPSVIDGTYSCQDSKPATWSQDPASKGEGFCAVFGILATETAAAAAPANPTAPAAASPAFIASSSPSDPMTLVLGLAGLALLGGAGIAARALRTHTATRSLSPTRPVGATKTLGDPTGNDVVEDEAGNLWHARLDSGAWHYAFIQHTDTPSAWAKAGHPTRPAGETRSTLGRPSGNDIVEDEHGDLWHAYLDGGAWHYQFLEQTAAPSAWAKAGRPTRPVGATKTVSGGPTGNDIVEDAEGNLWNAYLDGGSWHFQFLEPTELTHS